MSRTVSGRPQERKEDRQDCKTRFAFCSDDCTIRSEVREWGDRRLKTLARRIQQSLNDSGRTFGTTGGSRSILLLRDAAWGCGQEWMAITPA